MKNITQNELIRKYGVTAKKGLGQNFLCDEAVTAAIAEAVQAGEDELVFEIGPGLGAVSQHLAGFCGRFVAVELDRSLIPVLSDILRERQNTEIVNADALKFDFDGYAASLGYKSYKIVGNLPYYITTPIIMRILEECHAWDTLVFMMQREVAERLDAGCGEHDCGAVTYAVAYRAATERILEVPPTAFIPRPEVESTVLRFMKLPQAPVETKDEALLFRLIKAGFSQRRKTLMNSLVNNHIAEKELLQAAFAAAGIDEKRRGETLSLDEYNALSEYLIEHSDK